MRVGAARLLVPCAVLVVGPSLRSGSTIPDWSPQQVDCAATIGVTIGSDADYHGTVWNLRTLTWISAAVVRGVVMGVRTDPTGPYPTLVDVAVSHSFKGHATVGSTIVVVLQSGPVYSSHRHELMTIIQAHEPTFTAGEEVVLFLLKDFPDDPRDQDHFSLAEAQYGIFPKGKYVFDSQTASVANSVHVHAWADAVEQTELARDTQASNCR